MDAVDTLIVAEWVIPVDEQDATLPQHAVAIRDGVIVDIAEASSARKRYRAAETLELPAHALIPGLVNTHTHAAMTLLRGFADDLPLKTWLHDYIWPAETQWMGEDFVRCGTDLAIAEMIRSGTTCFNDMYFFPDVVAARAEAAGMRACVGLIMLDFATAWAQGPQEYLDKGLGLHDELRHSMLVTTAFAPHAPYTVSDEPLGKIRMLADELEMPVHIHLHETAHEIDESMARFGMRPLERLSRLGLLTPRLLAVHMTELLPAEIAAISDTGINVVHCPESNLKLASGMCPVSQLLLSGVNVALGTDGAASNNDLDMMGEMRTAALLAKGMSRDPTALNAHETLRMATLNGARALGLGEVTGSLAVGKAADIVAVDLAAVHTEPIYDPVSQIVYSATRDQVSSVWIAGQSVLRERRLVRQDENEVIARARRWRERIAA